MRKAVFPGSFDPITLGHCDIIERGLPLFDEIILAIGINAAKTYMFSLKERTQFLENTFKKEPKISIKTYHGLTAEFCQQEKAGFILRGLRNASDFDYEKSIAQTHYKLKGIETVFLIASAGNEYLSSTIARDFLRHGGDYAALVPKKAGIHFPE